MTERYPCPLWTHAPRLRPVALWLLDTFGDDPPMLVGVQFTEPKALFFPVELDPADPMASMADLIVPDSWDVLAVVVETQEIGSASPDGVISHAIDRAGRSATELDERCGRRRKLHARNGKLHQACLELFSVVGY